MASPNRETESMKDGSDAVGGLARFKCSSTLQVVQLGSHIIMEGVGMGYSLHAGHNSG